MKRLAVYITLSLLSLFTLSGCMIGGIHGSGVRKAEKRDLAPFTAIETNGAFEVSVVCQKPVSLEIEADDNILPLVETEVRGGVLHLTTTRHYFSSGGIVVRISVPSLEAVKSTGAGKFKITDSKGDRLTTPLCVCYITLPARSLISRKKSTASAQRPLILSSRARFSQRNLRLQTSGDREASAGLSLYEEQRAGLLKILPSPKKSSRR